MYKESYKYLFVSVDTFSGWPEVVPCCTNMAKVVKILLNQIIPHFGFLPGMSSDRGSHFTAKIMEQVSKALGIQWNLHTPYRPHASGKVERMNYTIKLQLSNLSSNLTDLSTSTPNCFVLPT